MKKTKKLLALLGIIPIFVLSGCATTKNILQDTPTKQQQSISVNGLSSTQYENLANGKYDQNKDIVFVNNNVSTLNPNAWKYDHVEYQNLDKLNRTSKSNTAFLNKENLANTADRTRQFIEPTGWHSNRPGKEIYNRGHLIAYSLSGGINAEGKYTGGQVGDQNNPKNLFTQTAYANQKLQTIYENKVRQALEQNKKVIFQATPIFKDNELMARGINLQAISTDKSLNFNVFIPNKQPGYIFDYATGRANKSYSSEDDSPTSTYNENKKYDKYSSKYYEYKKRAKDDFNTFKSFATQGKNSIKDYVGK